MSVQESFDAFVRNITPYADQFPPMVATAKEEAINKEVSQQSKDLKRPFLAANIVATMKDKFGLEEDRIDAFLRTFAGDELEHEEQIEHLKTVYAMFWILAANDLHEEVRTAVAGL